MKILQIAYYYPPMGGAGVQRALKFSKYLPIYGVKPVILACDDPCYVRDDTFLQEIPREIDVHRIKFTPWMSRMATRRRSDKNGAPTSSLTHLSRISTSIQKRLREIILLSARSLQMPDDAAAWAHQALKKARQIIRESAENGEPIELIMSSAPPVSTHMLGERLALEFNLPWIIDFRDLWTDNPSYDLPFWRKILDRRTEERWLARATGVITVTPTWHRMLASRVPPGVLTAFIPNGYDEADFLTQSTLAQKNSDFTIVHTGTFYGPRDPHALLEGLKRYLTNPQKPSHNLRVRLIGNIGARFLHAFQVFEQQFPGIVEIIPYVPHAHALAELDSADALLLVVGGNGRGDAVRGWLPGKIFEYLRVGKPILMLGDPDGDAAHLIRRHSRGLVIRSEDVDGLTNAFHTLASSRLKDPAEGNEEIQPVTTFERRELSRQLANFIRECQQRHVQTHRRKKYG
ncbi:MULTISPECIES: glycosyltransferase [Diaphorobacter]|uniref:glycosyltransferase n=1 Tax=Diaphorobacter TaxID=238749 RepID=UPI001651422C|nr:MULTISPECIES: glycosyltransferase [Diaphorobacter]